MTAPSEISVLIDTYQQGRFVARAVESVLAQTHPPAEIVVVDDGSTDETPRVLGQFGNRIRVITQANQGQAGALNTGLAAARGPWVAFLDGDDTWTPRHLELVAAASHADRDCDAVLAPLDRIDAADAPLAPEPADAALWAVRADLGDSARVRAGGVPWLPPTSGIACRLELLRSVGPIPADYRIAADGWIQVALQLRARRMVLLSERTVRLRVHADNRWTDRDELDPTLLGQRRALYERLAAAARTLAPAASGGEGLARALEAQATEFAIWELIVRGERTAARTLAARWSPSAAVTSPLHRGFRRAHVLMATMIPTRLYLGLRGAWRSGRAAVGRAS